MKILQLVTKRQYRGAEVFAANLSEELITLGHDILFVGLYDNHENILTVNGAKNLDLIRRKKEGISPKLVLALRSLLKKEKPDVVQCNGSDTLKYMVAASFLSIDIPIVYRNISTISEWLNSPIKKRIYKYLFEHVDYVTSVGVESIEDLRKTFNYPAEKTSVIRRGIPFEVFDSKEAAKALRNELGLEAKDKIAIHVGNFSPEKNHSFLLELFSKIKMTHPDIKLVCVGNGVTFEKVQKEIQEKHLEETVFLLGFRKDIPTLLAGSDCFVLSSLVEGVPGVILEAAVQKKPSVATNVGGVQEVIKHDETGFIIDNFDQEHFRSALINLLEDDMLRSRMGAKAYEFVLEEFNPGRNARKFEKLYQDLYYKSKGYFNRKNGKLRVLQIIQKKQFRGAELFASQLSNHLLERGHDVQVYSIYEGKADLPFVKGVKSFNRTKSERHLDFNGWRSIAKIVKTFRPDIVQANASDTLKYTVLSKMMFGWEAPLIYRNASVASFYIRSSAAKIWNRILLQHVDQIISVSNQSKKDLNSFFPMTRSKSEVITIGVEEHLDPEDSPYSGGEHNILHVGSFTREKNHLGLLRIFRQVLQENPTSHLHLIGEGPLQSLVRDHITRMGLVEKVTLHGEIKNPDRYIHYADVLVLPSFIEGLPAVILEAMYLQTPVVAYKVGGVQEVLNQDTGFPIFCGDEDAFAAAIKEILDTVPKDKISQARQLIQNRFMNKDLVDQFINSYKRILSNNRPPSDNQ